MSLIREFCRKHAPLLDAVPFGFEHETQWVADLPIGETDGDGHFLTLRVFEADEARLDCDLTLEVDSAEGKPPRQHRFEKPWTDEDYLLMELQTACNDYSVQLDDLEEESLRKFLQSAVAISGVI